MPAPNTEGVLRYKIKDMQVGDYIRCHANMADSPPTLFGMGSAEGYLNLPEVPLQGGIDGKGFFYFIKVDKGLLIADRVIRHSISWETLNTNELIQGKNYVWSTNHPVPDVTGIIRSLGGGNAFADANGNATTKNQGVGGWPTNNEWDKYLVRKDYGTGAGRDDVWHYIGAASYCQEIPANGVHFREGNQERRTARGYGDSKSFNLVPSNYTSLIHAFRPVFEYKEVVV